MIDEEGRILAGNATWEALAEAGIERVKVVQADGNEWVVVQREGLTEEQKRRLALYDNRAAELAEWDPEILAELAQDDGLLEGLWTGFELDDLLGSFAVDPAEEARQTLAERFLVPPFSVLDARQGYWQERKKAWLGLGIKSEVGRTGLANALPKTFRASTQARQVETRLDMDNPISIFDPVLAELMYTWFCPRSGEVLDPFAGGSVRGVVAAYLGRNYTGVELRPEQVEANRVQAEEVVPDRLPQWIMGDSLAISGLASGQYDFLFSCPPYYDLEVYSNLEGELSAKVSYGEFLKSYRTIIEQCLGMLKQDRFACFVVGDIRDAEGCYRGFIGDTIAAFTMAGASCYNEAILVQPLGTVMMQVSRNFPIGRKLGKTHQNVLVFVKGDWKKAAEACGQTEVASLSA